MKFQRRNIFNALLSFFLKENDLSQKCRSKSWGKNIFTCFFLKKEQSKRYKNLILHIIIIDFFGSEEDVDISQFDLT
jgi:hypothetical protein